MEEQSFKDQTDRMYLVQDSRWSAWYKSSEEDQGSHHWWWGVLPHEGVSSLVMLMQPQEAIELERLAINKMFLRFQVKNEEHLTEMASNICKRCGNCEGHADNCGLLGSMTWHVFAIYFMAISSGNWEVSNVRKLYSRIQCCRNTEDMHILKNDYII